MKILYLCAYYAPEQTAGSHLMQDLEDCFAIKHNIEYIVSTPTRGISSEIRKQYKHILREEKKDGRVIVNRFPMFRESNTPVLRAIRYFLCNIVQICYGSRVKNVDVIYSGSTPPTIGLACIQIGKILTKKQKKKVAVIYRLDDVFPDSLVYSGITHKGSMLWKIGRKIEDYVYRNVETIIVNSQGMRENLLKKAVPESKIAIVNNWIDFNSVKPICKENNNLFDELDISRNQFNVLYAGNFGEAQGAEIILKVAEKLRDYEMINFVIFGGGAHFNSFKEQANELPNIHVFNLLPINRVSEVYSLADVALITCKAGFGEIGMPSKTWSIMACNKRIIASFDIRSDLAYIIKECNAGIVVEPGNVDALADAVLQASVDHDRDFDTIRERAIELASKDRCTKEILRILEATVK